MTELQLIDREKSGGRTEWIVGRSPYFISHKPDGDELWLSHRPYGINEMVYKFNPQWAITLESIDNVIAGGDIADLMMIAAGNALPAEVENHLEDRGLIKQTDKPYAEITATGRKLIEGAI